MPSSGEPEAISLNELYGYLSQFHLSDSLAVFARINAALKGGVRMLSNAPIPADIRAWVEAQPENVRLQIYLESSRLARFLLLSGANDLNEKTISLHDQTLFRAFDLYGKLHDYDVEPAPGAGWIGTTFGRLSQWQFPLQTDRETLIGRAYLLFHLLPNEFTFDYSMEDKMKEYFDISAFEFIATGMALWFMTNGTLDYELKMEVDYLKPIVTPENQIKFRDLSSGEPRHYKKTLRGDDWNEMNKLLDIYYLDPFLKMPCIIVNRSNTLPPGTYLVPNAKYLLDRASTGIFYLLADKEQIIAKKEGKKGKNPFRVMFGALFRTYVGKQLRQAHAPVTFLDLDVEFPDNKEKLPDFALVKDDICVLFEVKLSVLTLNARTFFHDADLRADAKRGNIKKAIQQLTEFRQSILDNKTSHPTLSGIKTVIIVLIGYEDIFVANSSLLPILDGEYGNAVRSFQIGGIADVDTIGNALEKNADFIRLLNEKINSVENRAWSIVTFIEQFVPRDNKIVRSAFRSFMDHLIRGV